MNDLPPFLAPTCFHVRVRQYLEGASKPLESHAFFVEAACMCADISGFTALSEKHCKEGTAGLDALVQVGLSHACVTHTVLKKIL